MPVVFEDSRLTPILDKVQAGIRLSDEDGLAMYRSSDILALGYMANLVRERLHGSVTYFNVNRHLNPTNICYADCKFCSFFRKPRESGGYTHSIDECLKMAAQAREQGATELHIVGGLNTFLPFSYFTDLLSTLKRSFPEMHLKAFTMVELDYFARAWPIVRDAVVSILEAIWRILRMVAM
jgi:aminodeoxyfutalosine synthase